MAVFATTARKLMYAWHGGQFSALYAAASSGLVEDYAALVKEVEAIRDLDDKAKLKVWIRARQNESRYVVIGGTVYTVLPWSEYYRK